MSQILQVELYPDVSVICIDTKFEVYFLVLLPVGQYLINM